MSLTCRTISGFGNNLYQVAATLALAKKQGKDWNIIAPKVDGEYQEIRDWGGHYPGILNAHNSYLPKTLKEVFPKVPWTDYKNPKDTLISSYIFYYDIIEDHMNDIREILEPNPSIEKYISEKYGTTLFDMGIHLRYQGGSDSFSTDLINYPWIVDNIKKEGNVKTIVILSNRYESAQEFINKLGKEPGLENIQITLIKNEPVYIDFFIYANHCKSVICSNSTFSFWGGFLGTKKENVYIVPGYTPANCKTAIPNFWKVNSEIFYKI